MTVTQQSATRSITLRGLRRERPDLFKKAEELTYSFSINIVYPRNYPPDKLPLGSSGTLVQHDDLIGILTNEHVVQLIRDHDKNYVHLPNPYPLSGCLLLKICDVIQLPACASSGAGIDLALVVLDWSQKGDILQIGKRFWNLKESIDVALDQSLFHNFLWLAHGNCFEKPKLVVMENCAYWHHEYSGPYFLGPEINLIEKKSCYYDNLAQSFEFDAIGCLVDREGQDSLPDSFNGMSGSAVWRIDLDGKIDFWGVLVEEHPELDSKQRGKIIIHGPIALYRCFYPYFLSHGY